MSGCFRLCPRGPSVSQRGRVSRSFSRPTWYGRTTLHVSGRGHLGCVYFGASMDNATVIIYAQVSVALLGHTATLCVTDEVYFCTRTRRQGWGVGCRCSPAGWPGQPHACLCSLMLWRVGLMTATLQGLSVVTPWHTGYSLNATPSV